MTEDEKKEIGEILGLIDTDPKEAASRITSMALKHGIKELSVGEAYEDVHEHLCGSLHSFIFLEDGKVKLEDITLGGGWCDSHTTEKIYPSLYDAIFHYYFRMPKMVLRGVALDLKSKIESIHRERKDLDKLGMIKVLEIRGRYTELGGCTKLHVLNTEKGRAKIIRKNFSKTGNHWDEILFVSPDFSGEIAIKDISNTGKHRCKLLRFADGKIVKTTEPEDDYWTICPICSSL